MSYSIEGLHYRPMFNFFCKESPFTQTDIEPVLQVISRAYEVIRNHSSRSADEALTLLRDSVESLIPSNESNREGAVENDEDFAFTYEEESDPEIFFLPYVWEIIVCVVSSSILEWDKKNIKVFPLLSGVSSKDHEPGSSTFTPPLADLITDKPSAKDAADLV